MYAAYTAAREQPNWIDYFVAAAYPHDNTGLNSPDIGVDRGAYLVRDHRLWSLETGGIRTRDRRAAVQQFVRDYPALTEQPPSEYEGGPHPCPQTTAGDQNDFVPSFRRRAAPKRQADLLYNSCPANTYYGLGWYKMPGYVAPRAPPPATGCGEPLLYRYNYGGNDP